MKQSRRGGEVVYEHTDQKTTRILNWVTGKDTLHTEDVKEVLKSGLRRKLKSLDIEAKDEFDSLSINELVNYGKEMSVDHFRGYRITRFLRDFQNKMGYYFNEGAHRRYADRGTYSALWQLEREVRNPIIRFHSRNRARYSAVDNSVYINPLASARDGPVEDILAEFAHAQQVKELGSVLYFSRRQNGALLVAAEALWETIGYFPEEYSRAYDETYDEPGKIEYEAHEIIEPRLRERLRQLQNVNQTKKDTSPAH